MPSLPAGQVMLPKQCTSRRDPACLHDHLRIVCGHATTGTTGSAAHPAAVCRAGVRSLDLRGCPIEDEDMASVLSALSALEVLRLPGCRKLTARAVKHLAEAGGAPCPTLAADADPAGSMMRGWQLPAWWGSSALLPVWGASGGLEGPGEASQSGTSHASTLHPVLAAGAVRSPVQGGGELPAQGRKTEGHQAGANPAPHTGNHWGGST